MGPVTMVTGRILTILALLVASSFAFVAVQYLNLSNATLEVSLAKSCEKPPGYLLVTLDGRGFNDSINRGQPTIRVQRGNTVNILVCNLDSVQSHGFAIDHYFAVGVTLRPGEAYRVSFVAADPGSFTMYCNVFCTVHTFMKGKLIVN